jgi:type I restriction enzyme S subunit
MGQIGKYLNGRAFKKADWKPSGLPIIRIQNLTGSGKSFNYFQGEVEPRYLVQEGDLLFSWAATLGTYIWHGPEAVLNQHIFKVESNINPRFHRYLLEHSIQEMQSKTHGSGMVHITKSEFDKIEVLIPSPDEQSRIVETLDDHLSRLDKVLAEFSGARKNLILFERAILHEAFSLAASDNEMVEFKDFFNVVQPKFEGYKQNEYQMEGALPIIDQGSALIGGYVNEMTRRIDVQRPLVIFGDHTRCVKFVDFPFAIGADGTKVLEPTEAVDPRFAYWQLRATELRNRGYARHMGELRKVRFWLPETTTQSEIVQEVEQAFETSNHMRTQLEVQDTAVATMRRALLHSAFSGNLRSK